MNNRLQLNQPPFKAAETKKKQQEAKERYQYGNYDKYYGYRSPGIRSRDPRLDRIRPFLEPSSTPRRILDIGCNAGNVALELAMSSNQFHVTGIDIDDRLISNARYQLRFLESFSWKSRSVRDYTRDNFLLLDDKDFPVSETGDDFPVSMPLMFSTLPWVDPIDRTGFPHNINFKVMDIMDSSSTGELEGGFDVMLLFSITKWIHLHHGDRGIRILFSKCRSLLSSSGILVVEPQPLDSYRKYWWIRDKTLAKDPSLTFDLLPVSNDGGLSFQDILVEVGFTRVINLLPSPAATTTTASTFDQRPLMVAHVD